MKIAICTHFNKFQVEHNVFFPLFRWDRLFRDKGLRIDFIESFEFDKLKNYNCVIIHDRYFRHINGFNKIKKNVSFSRENLIILMQKLRNNGQRIIFYDGFDPVGALSFDIIAYVDKYIKKQVYSDINKYSEDHRSKSVRPWIDNPEYFDSNPDYVPCPPEHLHKIDLAWNIGLTDIRRGKGIIGVINNFFYKDYYSNSDFNKKQLLTSFRGTGVGKNLRSSQRYNLIKILTEMGDKSIRTGSPLKYSQFVKELNNCKALVSPFGGGEICYRDFEIFAQTSILIKPDVSHLKTFPASFSENETYIPISWDLADLEEKLIEIKEKPNQYKDIAINGHDRFLNDYNDGEGFVNHFLKVIL